MLIIGRRKGERIRIGRDIEIVVTDVSRQGVRIGIVAPADVPVVRSELQTATEEANRAAARSHLHAPAASAESAIVVTIDEFVRDSRSSST